MSSASTKNGRIAEQWWHGLQRDTGPNRAALARLRRVGRVRDALLEEAAVRLCRALPEPVMEAAALTAAVLAHVRDDLPGSVATRLGPGGAGAMSFLRFRRLIQADTPDDRLAAFRRAVALADRKLGVGDLADSLLAWNDRRRQRWLYEYFAEPRPAPPTEDSVA